MVRFSILYLTFTIASLFVHDAYTQAPPPACFQWCLQAAAPSSGCSSTDANCICSSATIVNSVAACLVESCALADLQTAQAYFNDLCFKATTSSTSASDSAEPTTSSASVSPSTSSSSKPTNHAKRSRSAPSFTSIGFAFILALMGW